MTTVGTSTQVYSPCATTYVSDVATIPAGFQSEFEGGEYTDPDNIGFPPSIPAEVDTWYEYYLHEKEQGFITDYIKRIGFDYGSNAAFRPGNPENWDALAGTFGVSTFQGSDYQRRRIRSAMVNCGAMYDAGDTGSNAGIIYYRTPILAVLDIHLAEPATMYCGGNNLNCEVDESVETMIIPELIEDVTDRAFTDQSYAVLVR